MAQFVERTDILMRPNWQAALRIAALGMTSGEFMRLWMSNGWPLQTRPPNLFLDRPLQSAKLSGREDPQGCCVPEEVFQRLQA